MMPEASQTVARRGDDPMKKNPRIGRPTAADPKIVPLRTFVTVSVGQKWEKKRGKMGVAERLRDLVTADADERVTIATNTKGE